eukprot:14288561-Alexandrium_andersonii.AAC.1
MGDRWGSEVAKSHSNEPEICNPPIRNAHNPWPLARESPDAPKGLKLPPQRGGFRRNKKAVPFGAAPS